MQVRSYRLPNNLLMSAVNQGLAAARSSQPPAIHNRPIENNVPKSSPTTPMLQPPEQYTSKTKVELIDLLSDNEDDTNIRDHNPAERCSKCYNLGHAARKCTYIRPNTHPAVTRNPDLPGNALETKPSALPVATVSSNPQGAFNISAHNTEKRCSTCYNLGHTSRKCPYIRPGTEPALGRNPESRGHVVAELSPTCSATAVNQELRELKQQLEDVRQQLAKQKKFNSVQASRTTHNTFERNAETFCQGRRQSHSTAGNFKPF